MSQRSDAQILSPLERAERLRQEAEWVMGTVRLREVFAPYGEVCVAGSCFLDLMAYPDIDVYVPPLSVEQLFRAGAQMAECPLVTHMNFEKGTLPDLPGGLYLKPRIQYGDWGRPWKIDIWSVRQDIIQVKMSELQQFKAALTPELREQILSYKNAILTADKRTPMYSGYFIYKAFLEEGVRDFQEVTRYLTEHGIKM